jgi:hypothetical protein
VGKRRRTEVADPDLVGGGGGVGEREHARAHNAGERERTRAGEREGARSRTRERENLHVRGIRALVSRARSPLMLSEKTG